MKNVDSSWDDDHLALSSTRFRVRCRRPVLIETSTIFQNVFGGPSKFQTQFSIHLMSFETLESKSSLPLPAKLSLATFKISIPLYKIYEIFPTCNKRQFHAWHLFSPPSVFFWPEVGDGLFRDLTHCFFDWRSHALPRPWRNPYMKHNACVWWVTGAGNGWWRWVEEWMVRKVEVNKGETFQLAWGKRWKTFRWG